MTNINKKFSLIRLVIILSLAASRPSTAFGVLLFQDDLKDKTPILVNMEGHTILDEDVNLSDVGVTVEYIRNNHLPPLSAVNINLKIERMKICSIKLSTAMCFNDFMWLAHKYNLKLSSKNESTLDDTIKQQMEADRLIFSSVKRVVREGKNPRVVFQSELVSSPISEREFSLNLRLADDWSEYKKIEKRANLSDEAYRALVYSSLAAPLYTGLVFEVAHTDLLKTNPAYVELKSKLETLNAAKDAKGALKIEYQMDDMRMAWVHEQCKDLKIICRDEEIMKFIATTDYYKNRLVLAKDVKDLEQPVEASEK